MKSIYINFNIFEGKKYSISDAEVIGDVPIEEEVYTSIVDSLNGLTYSRLMNGLNRAGIELDRKVLSELAIKEPAAFKTICEQAQDALAD